MPTSFNITMWIASARVVARAAGLCCALLTIACIALTGRVEAADALAKGAADYKPFAVEHIGLLSRVESVERGLFFFRAGFGR